MKKTFTVIAFLALSLGAFAQNTGKDRLEELENKTVEEKSTPKKAEKEYELFDFNILARMGGGYINVADQRFKPQNSYEFFLNTLEFELNPTKWLGLSLGLDLKWNSFIPKPEYVFSRDTNNDPIIIDTPAQREKNVSKLNVFSLAVPLSITFNFGSDFGLSLGAEAVYTPASKARIKDSYSIGDADYKVTIGPCNYPAFKWNIFACLYYGMAGVYFRFYPTEPLLPFSLQSNSSVGVIFNLAR